LFHCTHCGSPCGQAPGEEQRWPAGCPMIGEREALTRARDRYEDEETRTLAQAAARVEAAGYLSWSRVEEVMEFARACGFRRLGVAFCIGLRREARIACDIFTANGFEAVSVACKAGNIAKDELGLRDEEKVHPGTYESICNPVGQAAVLAARGTDLNVVVGLCVGHDSLFFRASAAPATVLVAKDRVTGHNPAAALYNHQSYFRSRVYGHGEPGVDNEGEEG